MILERYGFEIDLSKAGHTGCPRCMANGKDKSRNNLYVYGLDIAGEHKGANCFACNLKIPSQEWLRENGEELEEEVTLGSEFNAEINEKIKSETSTAPKGYRGIKEETSKPLGVRYRYSDETGEVVNTYYPITKEYKIVGYKNRIHPKGFSSPIGETGKDCDLFCQYRYRNASNFLIITGGEHDALAAIQMFKEADSGKFQDSFAVVSGTCGESSIHKQIQAQYNFINQFKKIYICMDNDEAGDRATEQCMKYLPRNKVYIMKGDYKDPNEALEKGMSKQFIDSFWKAKMYTPAGVYASNTLYSAALDCLDAQVISLPPFMRVASNMLGGGIVQEEITVILAKTSIGKTLMVNEITKHIIINHPEHTLGVLSLEATYKKYSRNLLSSFLHIPLHRKTLEEKQQILNDNREKIDQFYSYEDGSPRFYVCDDRGADVGVLQEKILEMIIHYGLTILVIDPYSDLLSGMSVQEQEELATWLKRIMKDYSITIIVISHVKKSSNNSDENITEDDAMGSSFLVKAAGITIALQRNKSAEDPVERNTTECFILKNREFSETGKAGSFYYDIHTATLHDKEQFFSNPENIMGSTGEY